MNDVYCLYCIHDEPRDLIHVVDETWGHKRWECRDQVLCAVRSGGLGRET